MGVAGANLAQINLGRLRHPIDAPQSREFAAAVDRINALPTARPASCGDTGRTGTATIHC